MEKLFIPKTIKVGFNYREDTYTKKLAYVIYYDAKGKLRKETSWSGWIQRPGDPKNRWAGRNNDGEVLSDEYEPKDLENVPTSGFVINKGVGGARNSWGWNARNEYIRVFDPRGFEFEISTANLIYILGECTSTKGKGLEGEFVYSWDGKELVLLPTDTYEYKKSAGFTALQDKKVTKTDMIPGRVYKFKSGETATYIGRFKYIDTAPYSKKKTAKKHIFIDGENNYIIQTGFTKLAEIINETPVDNLAELIETYESSKHFNEISKINIKPLKLDDVEHTESRYDSYKELAYGKFEYKYSGSDYVHTSKLNNIYLNDNTFVNIHHYSTYNLEKSTINTKTGDDITKKLEDVYVFCGNYSSVLRKILIDNAKNGYTENNMDISVGPFLNKLGIEFETTTVPKYNYGYSNDNKTVYYMTKEQFENNMKNGKFNSAYIELECGSEVVLEKYNY